MTGFKRSMVCSVIMALLLVPMMTATGHAQQKSQVVVKEWHIPTIFFMSGPMAGFGEAHKWLADQVVKDINAGGGIAGKPVVLDYCDSALDPTKATACIARAIDSKAVCMMGPLNDSEMKGSMPLAVRAGIFAFSGAATATIVEQFYPWTNFTLPRTDDSIKYQMQMWLKHEPGIKSATAIHEPLYPMIKYLSEGYMKTLASKGIKTNGIIEAPSGMVDYGPIVVKALATKADAFTIGASEAVAAKIVKGLVSRGINPRHIYIQSGFVGPTFLQDAKGFADGVYSPTSPTHAPTAAFVKYMKAYKDSHNGRAWGGMTFLTYDMLYMIKDAIEKTGVTGDPAKVKEERAKIKDYAINIKDFKGMDATYDVVKGLAEHYPQRLNQVKGTEVIRVDEMKP